MKRLLTDDEILSLAESKGFEMNDFGHWNCDSDDILELVGAIEEYYNVLETTYDE